jgi:hypothetical protein
LLIYIIIKKKKEKRSGWKVGKRVSEAVKGVEHVSKVVFA